MIATTLLRRTDKQERCGLILASGHYLELENIAEDPQEGFEMDPIEVLQLMSEGSVVGTWHTHPTTPPVLSGADYNCFRSWPDLRHEILGFDSEGKYELRSYVVRDGIVFDAADLPR